jgi:3-isopropylmalate/(R)-2-methylmalate dehydratase small subunit
MKVKAFQKHSGYVVPIDRANIDTDIIFPKQFLKHIERTGFGKYLMYDWRFNSNGEPRSDFVLNQQEYKNASILLTRENFGSGSSRENAVWALQDFGFQVIVAPSFADIFKINCSKTGLLLVELDTETVETLFEKVNHNPGYSLQVDLDTKTVKDDFSWKESFFIDHHTRIKLLNGWDDISLTLQAEEQIKRFEEQRPFYMDPQIS